MREARFATKAAAPDETQPVTKIEVTKPMTESARLFHFSDEQVNAIYAAATPLSPTDRGAFLQALAERLRGVDEIGDGLLYRTIVELQRLHFDPPLAD